MGSIDILLNVAALLLWLAATGFVPEGPPRRAGSLLGNLQVVEVRRRRHWVPAVGLVGLLFVRALFYRHLGSSLNWTPTWTPGPVSVAFRSDLFLRIFLYSLLSFGWALFGLYASLFLISAVTRKLDEPDSLSMGIQNHLSWLAGTPRLIAILLPSVVLSMAWWVLAHVFEAMQLLPKLASGKSLLIQSSIVGFSGILVWRWCLTVILVFGFLENYIYFGDQPVWRFFKNSSKGILRPFRWLPTRIGKFEFAQLILVALVWVTTSVLLRGKPAIFSLPTILGPTHRTESASGVPWLRRWYLSAGEWK